MQTPSSDPWLVQVVVDGMAGWGETPASESKQEASESKPEAKKEEGTDKEPRGMDAVRAILAGQNYFKVPPHPNPTSSSVYSVSPKDW